MGSLNGFWKVHFWVCFLCICHTDWLGEILTIFGMLLGQKKFNRGWCEMWSLGFVHCRALLGSAPRLRDSVWYRLRIVNCLIQHLLPFPPWNANNFSTIHTSDRLAKEQGCRSDKIGRNPIWFFQRFSSLKIKLKFLSNYFLNPLQIVTNIFTKRICKGSICPSFL